MLKIKNFLVPQNVIAKKVDTDAQSEDLRQFLLGKAYTYLRFATILQRISAEHMCVLRRLSTCLGDKENKNCTTKKNLCFFPVQGFPFFCSLLRFATILQRISAEHMCVCVA